MASKIRASTTLGSIRTSTRVGTTQRSSIGRTSSNTARSSCTRVHMDWVRSVSRSASTATRPRHTTGSADNDTHLAGSAMFDHTTKGWSNIYCVRHQSICSEGDIYDQLIKGMSLATEQQIVY